MASLSRSALREHIFKIVFSSDFRKDEEPESYIPLYFECITDLKDEPLAVSESDRKYIAEKSEQIILMIPEADALISKYAKGWSLSRIGKAELALLRLSIYEVLYDENIPQNVAINEAVELAKLYGDEQAPKFINGILSSVLTEKSKAE